MKSSHVALVGISAVLLGVVLGVFGAISQLGLGGPQASTASSAAPTNADIANMFQNTIYDSFEWDHMQWLGVHAQQNPTDVWSYQQIFQEVKPDFVIEAGTNHGGGALVWATLLSVINPAGKVFTIDISDMAQEARKVPLFNDKVEFFLGSSTSDAVYHAIRARAQGKKAVVILDSLHTKDHVLREINLYGDIVSVGSYLLVQDTNINGHPVLRGFGPGPHEAVEEFMATGGTTPGGAKYEIDRSRELLHFSWHPTGYLKRVK